MSDPVLRVARPTGPAHAVVLVLHGGRAHGTGPVRAHQLAVVRMAPFARTLREIPGLAVARLRYRVRGWNDTLQSPVADTRWALDRLADDYPSLPVALVGHSMGGRAALCVADHPAVTAVVALAPWVEPGDPASTLTGRRLLVIHGDRDSVTSPAASRDFARAAQPVAKSVAYVRAGGVRHPMLRRAAVWHRLSAAYVAAALGLDGARPADRMADLAHQALAAPRTGPLMSISV